VALWGTGTGKMREELSAGKRGTFARGLSMDPLGGAWIQEGP
jgi:hypothetical protein